MKRTKTLNQHEDNYIHIPKPSLLPLLGTIFFGLLSVQNIFVIVSLWYRLDINLLFEATEHTTVQLYSLGIVPILILEYILISLTVISITALIKGGYDKLKSISDDGFIVSFIGGLIVGLAGLIGGFISGGLIVGIIVGLTVCLIVNFIICLTVEFDD